MTSCINAAAAPLSLRFRRPYSPTNALNPPTPTRAPFFAPRRPLRSRSQPLWPLPPPASSIWDAITGRSSNAREALFAVRRGMTLFREGDVSGSMTDFDRAIELDPRQKAYLWQRGLSLYYLNRFEEGAEQFRNDVAENPNDTEESIWCFLCEAQIYGAEEARKRFLEVGRDPRPVMRDAYIMFRDGGDPDEFVSKYLNGKDSEYFYASLYSGLYEESKNDSESAKSYIVAACQSPYGSRSEDYMAALAKAHCLCRKWCPVS